MWYNQLLCAQFFYQVSFKMNFILNFFAVFSCSIFLVSKAAVKPRIIGREIPVYEGEFPFMVQINPGGCGGTMIGRQYILTAKHCVRKGEPRDYNVHYGSVNDKGGHKIRVANILRFNQFDDLAILQLSQPIPDPYYVPIQLPNQEESFLPVVQDAIILGWGRTVPHIDKLSPVLKKLTVQALNSHECRSRYPNQISDPYFALNDKKICVIGQIGQEGVEGACKGDSGGPLIINGVQYGISSHGFSKDSSCLSTPTAYVLVSAYRDWIASIIGY